MAFDVERISAAMRALLVQCPGFIDGTALTDFCDAMSEAIVDELNAGGAGGVDLSGGSFVTWQADGSLSNEKVLGVGTGLSKTDATIALADTAVTAGAYTYASITVDAQGRLTAASSGTAPPADISGKKLLCWESSQTGLSDYKYLGAATTLVKTIVAGNGGAVKYELKDGIISEGTKTVIGSGTVTVDTYGRVTGVAAYTKPTVNWIAGTDAKLKELLGALVTSGVINGRLLES